MYSYIVGTKEYCENILALIESILCTGYSAVMQVGDMYYVPIYACDASKIPAQSMEHDEFITAYWEQQNENI